MVEVAGSDIQRYQLQP